MTVQAGTINGVTNVYGNFEGAGKRKAYMLAVSFPAYTGSTDTFSIAGVGAAIAASTKNGKGNPPTLIAGICAGPGLDTNGQAVYATGGSGQAITVSTDALTGNLSDNTATELTSATASQGVLILVTVDEP